MGCSIVGKGEARRQYARQWIGEILHNFFRRDFTNSGIDCGSTIFGDDVEVGDGAVMD